MISVRLLAALAALPLTIGLVVPTVGAAAVPTNAPAANEDGAARAAKPKVSLKGPKSKPKIGDKVSVKGKVSGVGSAKATVKIERKKKKKSQWVKVTKTKTTSDGTYKKRLKLPEKSKITLRAKLVKPKSAKGTKSKKLVVKFARPSAPTSPSQVAAVALDASARVSWSPPADQDGSAVTGYTVVAAPGGQQFWTQKSFITISGLRNGTEYTFFVLADSAEGSSPPSVESNPVVPFDPEQCLINGQIRSGGNPVRQAVAAASDGSTLNFAGNCIDHRVVVTNSLTFTGMPTGDKRSHVIDAALKGRVIEVRRGGDLTLDGELKITGGQAQDAETREADAASIACDSWGGGICTEGDLTLTGDVVIANNVAYDTGGVQVVDFGSLKMMGNAAVRRNSSSGVAGGVDLYRNSEDAAAAKQAGRPIFEMQGNASIHDNVTALSGDGGGVYIEDGTMVMNGGSISGNFAGYGGGSSVESEAEFTMNSGTISGNVAGEGGGVFLGRPGDGPTIAKLRGGLITGNSAIAFDERRTGSGGGIYQSDGASLDLSGTSVSGNTAEAEGNEIYRQAPG